MGIRRNGIWGSAFGEMGLANDFSGNEYEPKFNINH